MESWTNPEQTRLAKTSQIEATIVSTGVRLNTAFVGSIPDGVTDETIERLLSACGPINKWKRVLDASNMPKNFGFCEFGSADAMNRALSILHGLLMVGGKRLIVKVDDVTMAYLKKYEDALDADSVEMSSKEADLKALNEISVVLKEKSFYPALETIEKKLSILTAEAPEEGEAIDDFEEELKTHEDKRRGSDYDRSRSRERRDPRPHENMIRAFKERESRWEAREAQMTHRRRRDEQIEAERMKSIKEEGEYAAEYLDNFDDFDWLINSLDKLVGIERSVIIEGRVPDFYANRELWKTRRFREREREGELDRRDEQLEKEELEREREKQQKEDEQLQVKRIRPKASEFINEEKTVTHKRRKPLISKDYTQEELVAAGMSNQEAISKLREIYKEKVAKLISIIPQSQNELFDWPIEWKYFDYNKIFSWVHKKCMETLVKLRKSERHAERITQSLMVQIQQHSDPRTIITWAYEDGMLIDERSSFDKRKEEAVMFIAILWRYLVYETEATAYNLKPPQ